MIQLIGWRRTVAVGIAAALLGAFALNAGVSFAEGPSMPDGTSDPAGALEAPALPVAPDGSGAALPPQAPVANTDGQDASQLPSAGSGGYLETASSANRLLILAIGLALIASGALGWTFQTRRR